MGGLPKVMCPNYRAQNSFALKFDGQGSVLDYTEISLQDLWFLKAGQMRVTGKAEVGKVSCSVMIIHRVKYYCLRSGSRKAKFSPTHHIPITAHKFSDRTAPKSRSHQEIQQPKSAERGEHDDAKTTVRKQPKVLQNVDQVGYKVDNLWHPQAFHSSTCYPAY